MVRNPEANAKYGKYQEIPVLEGLATTIRTVDDVRPEPPDARCSRSRSPRPAIASANPRVSHGGQGG